MLLNLYKSLSIRLITIALGATLSAGCTSKEEKDAERERAAAESAKQEGQASQKLFDDASFVPVDISTQSLREATEPRAIEDISFLNPAPPPATQEGDPVFEGSAEPVSYTAICLPMLANNPIGYLSRCAGQRVSGVARVRYSDPRIGTSLSIGEMVFTVASRIQPPAGRFLYNDLVKVEGILGKSLPDPRARLEDATLEPVEPGGSPDHLRVMTALRLGVACYDLMAPYLGGEYAVDDARNLVEGSLSAPFLKKAALHPSLPNTGVVEIENRNTNKPERCLFKNNKIQLAQIEVEGYVMASDRVWVERGAEYAKRLAYRKKSDSDGKKEEQEHAAAYLALSTQEKLKRLTTLHELSAEAIATAMLSDPSAEFDLNECSAAMRTGLTNYKQEGTVGLLENSGAKCGSFALKLCKPELANTPGCKAFAQTALPIWRVLKSLP